ncbi:hypothetical protein HDU91_006681, partial [Kappamyces sp. JEL0680]
MSLAQLLHQKSTKLCSISNSFLISSASISCAVGPWISLLASKHTQFVVLQSDLKALRLSEPKLQTLKMRFQRIEDELQETLKQLRHLARTA